MLALADNPPVLSPGMRSIAESSEPWWVAHTKSRCEKAFAADLLARDIAYFLPMLERVRVSGGRRRFGMAPLFASYVFFSGDVEARYRAIATGRLCQVLRVADQVKLIGELSAVHQALQGLAPLEPHPHVAVGKRCRVTAGPFCGLEGTVIRIEGRTRIVLTVGILGRGAAMEIHPDLLEPVETTPAQRCAAV